jgi:excisionase family DNA binding protein
MTAVHHDPADVADRPVVPAVLYRVDEAAEALRLSRSSIYELIRSGQLRTVKHGARRLVPVDALGEFVRSLGQRAS